MKRIGVFLDQGRTASGPELAALAELGANLQITSSIGELELCLRGHGFDALVLLHGADVSRELEGCLQKSRNFSHARPVKILAIARSLDTESLNRLGRLGVLWIYAEPVVPAVWAGALRELLGLDPGAGSKGAAALTPIGSVQVAASVFGRIGRLHVGTPGAISVETSLTARPGDYVTLDGKFVKEFPAFKPHFVVKSVHHDDLYYRYDNRLELEPAYKFPLEQWMAWLAERQKHWVAPKTKLLWITERHSVGHEALFDKSLFSVYLEHPGHLSWRTLERICPRIVLIDDLSPDTEALVEKWRTSGLGSEPKLVVTSRPDGASAWKQCPCFVDGRLSSELSGALRDFLKERIRSAARESKFVGRMSLFSRTRLPFDAWIDAISFERYSLVCPIDIQVPAPVSVQFNDPRLRGLPPLFGRTLQSEPLEAGEGFRVLVEWVPRSSAMGRVRDVYRVLSGLEPEAGE